MARANKTFRPTELVATKLREKAVKEGKSESDLINMALSCFLGIVAENSCETLNDQIAEIRETINNIVKLNDLKTEG